MFIDLWIEFIGSMFSFQPFYYIMATILGVCCVLLIRSMKVW